MIKILCLGDSNTYGYDPRSFGGGRYPENVRWTGLLESAGTKVLNYGINGQRVPDASAYSPLLDQIFMRHDIDIVVLMLGDNDVCEGAGAEKTAARMEALIRCITGKNAKAKVVLVAPPAMETGLWIHDDAVLKEADRLCALYEELAGGLGIVFADAREWGVDMIVDGVHFSPEGHAAFAKGLNGIISGIVSSGE